MAYSSHTDNAKFGLVLGGLALAGYGLFKDLEWLLTQLHCVFQSF